MSGQKITFKNNELQVPDNPIIPFIEGDGIGPDIWAAAVKVFDAAVKKAYKGKRKIEWKEILVGKKAFDKTGKWLPTESLREIKKNKVAIKGPLTTPVGGGIRSLNVALRQKLDLYACVRPVVYFKGVPSPVKRPQEVDMVIFRENTEDIYAGIEYLHGTAKLKKLRKFLIEEMKVKGIRFPEASIDHAIKEGLPSVTLVHKGNIMKFTEGKFKEWGYELAEREYGNKVWTWAQYDRIAAKSGKAKANKMQEKALAKGAVLIKDVIADAFLQQIILRPSEYSVIATLNLNGDYVSDALAAQVGGIGIAPGANINYNTGVAIFEATHGTAPKYTGLDKVNPSSVILSGEMMFRYLGWNEAADLIVKGVGKSIRSKRVTYDFERLMKGAKLLKCSQFGKEIIKNM